MKSKAYNQLIKSLNLLNDSGTTKVTIQPWQRTLLGSNVTPRDGGEYYRDMLIVVADGLPHPSVKSDG